MRRLNQEIPEAWEELNKTAGTKTKYVIPALGTAIGAIGGSQFDDPMTGSKAGTITGGILGGLTGRYLRQPFVKQIARPIMAGKMPVEEVAKQAGLLSNRILGYGLQAAGMLGGAAVGSNLDGQNDSYGTIGGMVGGALLGTKMKGLAHTQAIAPFRRGKAKLNGTAPAPKAPSSPNGSEPATMKTDNPPVQGATSQPAAERKSFLDLFSFKDRGSVTPAKPMISQGKAPSMSAPQPQRQAPQVSQAPQPAQRPAAKSFSAQAQPDNPQAPGAAYSNTVRHNANDTASMYNQAKADNLKLKGEDSSYHKFASKLASYRRN